MEKFWAVFDLMIAFMLPIFVGVAVTGNTDLLWWTTLLAFVYLWLSIDKKIVGVDRPGVNKAAALSFCFGLVITVLFVVTGSTWTLCLIPVMAISFIANLYYL